MTKNNGSGGKAGPKKKKRGQHNQVPGKSMSKHAAPLDPDRDFWEQQPAETAKAYEAFTTYRDQVPTGRSMRLVAVSLGKNKALIEGWGARWSWLIRVHEWDREAERLLTDRHWADIQAMSDRHADAAVIMERAMLEPASAFVRTLGANPNMLQSLFVRDDGTIDQRGLVQVMGMIVTAARIFPSIASLEREVRGQPALMPGDSGVEQARTDVRNIVEDDETRALAVQFFRRLNGYS